MASWSDWASDRLSFASRVAHGAYEAVRQEGARTVDGLAPDVVVLSQPSMASFEKDFWLLSEAFSALDSKSFQEALEFFQWLTMDPNERKSSPANFSRAKLMKLSHDRCFRHWADFLFAPVINTGQRLSRGLRGPSLVWQYLVSYHSAKWDSLESFRSYHDSKRQGHRVGGLVPAWMLRQAKALPTESLDRDASKKPVISQWKGVWRFVKIFGLPCISDDPKRKGEVLYSVGLQKEGPYEDRYADEIAFIPQGYPSSSSTAASSSSSAAASSSSSVTAKELEDVKFLPGDGESYLGAYFPQGHRYYQSVVLRIWAMQQSVPCERVRKHILHDEVTPLFYSAKQFQRGDLPEQVPWGALWNGCFAQHGLAIPRDNRQLGLALFYAFYSQRENCRSKRALQRFIAYHRGDSKLASPVPNTLVPHWVLMRTGFGQANKLQHGEWVVWIHPQGGTARYGRFEHYLPGDGEVLAYVTTLEPWMQDSLTGDGGPKPRAQAFPLSALGTFPQTLL